VTLSNTAPAPGTLAGCQKCVLKGFSGGLKGGFGEHLGALFWKIRERKPMGLGPAGVGAERGVEGRRGAAHPILGVKPFFLRCFGVSPPPKSWHRGPKFWGWG